MKEKLTATLDGLLTGNNSSNEKIISGYNYYPKVVRFDNIEILTFSHSHETSDYLLAMFGDLRKLGYPSDNVLMQLRNKYGSYRWENRFRFRDDKGDVYPNLKIRDTKTNQYVDLQEIPFQTLEEAGYDEKTVQNYVGEDKGWEINIGCDYEEDILKLAKLFTQKSSDFPFDQEGFPKVETVEERLLRSPWPGPHETPILIIGGNIKRLSARIPLFIPAKKIECEFNDKELSFIIHNKYQKLCNLPEYVLLLDLGFEEEDCLANIPFIQRYVDQ